MPRIRGIANLFNPALAASVPTAAQWLQPTFSFTGTSSNGSANITSITSPYVPANWATSGNILPGTNTYLLGPGLPNSGTLATVSSITSATQIVSTINATTALGAGTGVFTVYSVNPSQSTQAGYWPGYTLPPVGSDVVGCLYEIPFVWPTVYANSALVLPPGDVLISLTSAGTTAVVLQAYIGTSSPSWTTIHSFGTAAIQSALYVPSDGANIRILVGSANPPTALTLYQFR